MIKNILGLVAGVSLSMGVANAAEISVQQYTDGEYFILFEGTIEEGDLEKFKTAYIDTRIKYDTVVEFNSPGGSLDETLKIADYIENSSIRTNVSSGSKCMSGCAILWAYGEVKYMQSDAVIGFHMSYIPMTPESTEMLDGYKSAFGWWGVQNMLFEQATDMVHLYNSMPVADPQGFVYGIVMEGNGPNDFFMITPENSYIIGGVNVYR